MSASFEDLIIDDEYLEEISGQIRKLCKEIEKTYKKYTFILTKVVAEAIKKGETHDAIEAFLKMAKVISGKFEDVGTCVPITLDCFLWDIDDSDEYLY